MTLPLSLFTHARDADRSAVADLRHDLVVARLREWFAIWERRASPDHEVLGDAGIMLGEAGQNALDVAACDWHAEAPSTKRVEIVSDFLAGYWRASIPDVGALQSLVSWLDTTPRETWAYAVTLLALFVFASSDPPPTIPAAVHATIRRRVQNDLLALRKAGLHPGVAQYVDYLIDQ